MTSQIELTMLPPIFYTTDSEKMFIRNCIENRNIHVSSFRLENLIKMAHSLGIVRKSQTVLFQRLLDLGVLYSLSKEPIAEISPNVEYFLNAEKSIQALISTSRNDVIGLRLFKFENEGKMFDGGFIVNNEDVFNSLMNRLTAFYGIKDGMNPYLPSFIRLYECIGVADGRDFFTKKKNTTKLTYDESEESETIFYIPKYVLLSKDEQTENWSKESDKIAVCIA